MKHTVELWRVAQEDASFWKDEIPTYGIIGAETHRENTPGGWVDLTMSKNNLDRIVSCVNALAGLNPQALKELIEAAKGVVNSGLPQSPLIDTLRSALQSLEDQQ